MHRSISHPLAAAVSAAALGAAALAPAAALASPGNGSNTLTLAHDCDDGRVLTFVIPGPGIFAPGKVVETGETWIPTSFTRGGELLRDKNGPAGVDEVTCTTGDLVVTGFFVPASSGGLS